MALTPQGLAAVNRQVWGIGRQRAAGRGGGPRCRQGAGGRRQGSHRAGVGSVQEAEGSEGAGVVQCTGGCSSAGGGGSVLGGMAGYSGCKPMEQHEKGIMS